MELRKLRIIALGAALAVACQAAESEAPEAGAGAGAGADAATDAATGGSIGGGGPGAPPAPQYSGANCAGAEDGPQAGAVGACTVANPCGGCMESDPGGCGIEMAPNDRIECGTDADCAPGICRESRIVEPCAEPSTVRVCTPGCPEAPCAADEICGADQRCAPATCATGYTCPAGRHCPGPGEDAAEADGRGCLADACADGFACAPGFECAAGADASACAVGVSDGPARAAAAACAEQLAHGCAPVHCERHEECPQNHICVAGAPGNGCVRRTCAADTDCDCGACVPPGVCMARPWICWEPPA